MKIFKYLFSVTLVLYSFNSFAQFNALRGRWISANNEMLVIDDSLNQRNHTNMISTPDGDNIMDCFVMSDTLRFQVKVDANGDYQGQIWVVNNDFKIISHTDTILTLLPISNPAGQYFGNSSVSFVKQKYNRDTTIQFEKLIYHTSTCVNHCPNIDIEIDKNRNIYLAGHFYKKSFKYETDLTKSGLFVGKLSTSLYNELLLYIETCNLRTLEFIERPGDDAPEVTLIVYYNGERKYLKSRYPPAISQELLNYLLHINERAALRKTFEKRTLEY